MSDICTQEKINDHYNKLKTKVFNLHFTFALGWQQKGPWSQENNKTKHWQYYFHFSTKWSAHSNVVNIQDLLI